MYLIDLTKITLDEFETTLLTVHLLPSQRVILKNLTQNIQRLRNKGFMNLHDVRNLLKRKKDYSSIAEDTGIEEEYLIILNRMVNSYIVKELPLTKLEIFTSEEIGMLAEQKITSTRDYYEAYTATKQKEPILTNGNIPMDKVNYALHIIDLVRINGVGVDYAKILFEIGIKSVADYNKVPSEEILKSFQELNKKEKVTKATLGITDIDYCRRFCEKLDCDIS